MNDLLNRIVKNPDIRSGKPTIKNTRLTVVDILSYLAGGMTPAEIVDDFPQITLDDVRACCSYAAETLQPNRTDLPAVAA